MKIMGGNSGLSSTETLALLTVATYLISQRNANRSSGQTIDISSQPTGDTAHDIAAQMAAAAGPSTTSNDWIQTQGGTPTPGPQETPVVPAMDISQNTGSATAPTAQPTTTATYGTLAEPPASLPGVTQTEVPVPQSAPPTTTVTPVFVPVTATNPDAQFADYHQSLMHQ
jgi:hypothetical protein